MGFGVVGRAGVAVVVGRAGVGEAAGCDCGVDARWRFVGLCLVWELEADESASKRISAKRLKEGFIPELICLLE